MALSGKPPSTSLILFVGSFFLLASLTLGQRTDPPETVPCVSTANYKCGKCETIEKTMTSNENLNPVTRKLSAICNECAKGFVASKTPTIIEYDDNTESSTTFDFSVLCVSQADIQMKNLAELQEKAKMLEKVTAMTDDGPSSSLGILIFLIVIMVCFLGACGYMVFYFIAGKGKKARQEMMEQIKRDKEEFDEITKILEKQNKEAKAAVAGANDSMAMGLNSNNVSQQMDLKDNSNSLVKGASIASPGLTPSNKKMTKIKPKKPKVAPKKDP